MKISQTRPIAIFCIYLAISGCSDNSPLSKIPEYPTEDGSISSSSFSNEESSSSFEKISSDYSSSYSSSSSFITDTTVSEIWNGKTTIPQTEYRNGDYYMAISTAEELAYFANQVTNLGNTSLNAYLTKNIRLNPDSMVDKHGNLLVETSELREWTPIGSNELKHLYAGIFDGNGHTVSGVYVNNPSADRAGFFGTTSNATIKNLGIVNSYILGKNYVGGIAGRANEGFIDQVFNEAFVSGNYAGGIVGYMSKDSLTNAYNKGKIYSTLYAAGIAGYKSSGTINATYNIGSIRGSGTLCGISCYGNSTNSYYIYDSFVELVAKNATEKNGYTMQFSSFAATLNSAAGDTYWHYNSSINSGYPIFSWEEE